MKLHIKMEVSKQQLKEKKVKYQECLCLALDLGCAEVSIPTPHINVFTESHFKEDLHKPEISSSWRKKIN